jgi:hypothetical protein
VAFIVDTSSLDNFDDIKCDDMGTWKKKGVDKSSFSVKMSTTNVTEVKKTTKASSSMKGVFPLKRVYRVHVTDPSLRKLLPVFIVC